jgi:branched-chain amino acid transport system permease protein
MPISFGFGVICHKYFIRPFLKSPQDIQILLTFGLVLVLQNMALLLWKSDWRSLSNPIVFQIINWGGISLKLTMVIAFMASWVLVILLFLFLTKTDYGKAIRACADDNEGAMFVGLNLNKIYYLTFGIGAALAGIAGALFLPFFAASPTVGLLFTLQAFIIIVLGGLGSVPGALVGGMIIGITESLGALFLSGSLKSVATFVIFIAIICIKPSGIFGQKERV